MTEDGQMTAGDGFDCEAYGPEGRALGALCFGAPQGERTCAGLADCQAVMAAGRRSVYRRIQGLAAAGDPVAEHLAGEFTSPDQLLGGSGEDDR